MQSPLPEQVKIHQAEGSPCGGLVMANPRKLRYRVTGLDPSGREAKACHGLGPVTVFAKMQSVDMTDNCLKLYRRQIGKRRKPAGARQ